MSHQSNCVRYYGGQRNIQLVLQHTRSLLCELIRYLVKNMRPNGTVCNFKSGLIEASSKEIKGASTLSSQSLLPLS